MSVDLVTVGVVRGKLTYAAEEMGIALRKSAYSPNIKERMDHSCAIFDAKRRLVAQAEHIPVHLGSMIVAVQQGLASYRGDLEEGDMLLFNDPYISGTHLPDITLIAPVYYRGEVIAYVANKAHHSDVGGKAPGSMPGDSAELFEEGIIVPPVKFVKKGRIDRELAEVILSNVRTPRERMGDLRAQVAANLLGIRRVIELAEKYGVERLEAAMEEIMAHSERMMRRELEKIPDGVYRAEDYLESTGTSDDPVRIAVEVTVKGSCIKFDYTGTSPQVDGPVNAPFGVTLAGVFYVMICVTDPSIPVNDGCYRPIEVHVPEGTLLNPRRPAAVCGGNVETSQRNVDVLFRALAQAVPDRVCAAGSGTMNNISVGGVDPESGELWAFYETIGGGYGARPGLDGVDGVHVHMTNTMNTPIEAIEAQFPILFLSYKLREDSGGPGKWRGGCGIERSWKLLAPSATLSVLAERNKMRPWGLMGGLEGAAGEHLIVRRGRAIRLKSKCTVRLQKGDVLVVRTPGGGGYGSPLERSIELVLKDVRNGLVSPEAARRHYGVAVDPRTLAVDYEETRKLRSREVSCLSKPLS
ncbi:MAG: hydantoinase B/oxoprolinase family protein [Thermoproteota archaeon]|nr:MAG: hydantoinase B/oxoprolinase family protein [Candidatus Korarchaeota archaeon]